jgi:hypothetical protein
VRRLLPSLRRPLRAIVLVLAVCFTALGAAEAAPRVVGLSAEWTEAGYRASFRLQGGFEQPILDTIASGLPVTFEYRIEVYQRRPMWIDLVHLQQMVKVSVDYDSLTRQYSLTREVAGQVVESLSTEKPEEMRRWMSEISDVDVGALSDTVELTGREQLRVKCRLASDFVFFFFPRFLETRWARIPLPPVPPAEETADESAQEKVP